MATTITDRRRLFLRADGIFAVPAAEGSEGGGTGGGTPDPHAPTHAAGGSDPVTLTQAQITGLAAALAGKASTTHAATHQPGGADAMAVDAAAATGSLRTLGTGATQAAPGNDARFTAPSIPIAHHATHEPGGSDALANAAWTNVANTFTQDQAVSKALPAVVMHDTNEAADARRFRVRNFGGELAFAALSDANVVQKTPLALDRAGNAVVGTNLTVGGNASVFGAGGNVAVKDQANTFTQDQTIAKSRPRGVLHHTGSTTKGRVFAHTANRASLSLNSYFDDAGAAQRDDSALNGAEVMCGDGAVYIVTHTTADGRVVRAQFDPDGRLVLIRGQLQFPATQNPSTDATTLDDYREGTFTPTLLGSSGQSGQVYSIQTGAYVKVGKWVFGGGRVGLTTAGTFTGTLRLGGFPVPAANVFAAGGVTVTSLGGLTVSISSISGAITLANAFADLVYVPAAGGTGFQSLAATAIASGFDMYFTLSYLAAN